MSPPPKRIYDSLNGASHRNLSFAKSVETPLQHELLSLSSFATPLVRRYPFFALHSKSSPSATWKFRVTSMQKSDISATVSLPSPFSHPKSLIPPFSLRFPSSHIPITPFFTKSPDSATEAVMCTFAQSFTRGIHAAGVSVALQHPVRNNGR